jgi:non-specific serine/threonine protein kinase
MDRFEVEHDNLRAALAWARKRATDPDGADAVERGLRLASELANFWGSRGYLMEGRAQLTGLLAVAGAASAPLRAQAIHAAAGIVRAQCDWLAAQSLHEQALALYEDLGDRPTVAHLLLGMGTMRLSQGDLPSARRLYAEGLSISRATGDRFALSRALNELGLMEAWVKNYREARALIEESLAVKQAEGDPRKIAVALNNLAIAILGLGDPCEARRLFSESLRIKWRMRIHVGVPWTLAGMAGAAAAQGMAERAARLYSAAAAGRERIGNDLPPDFDEAVAALREVMPDDAFAAAWAEGAALTLEEAVDYALGER